MPTEANPYCDCCSSANEHFNQHFDPDALLRGAENAVELAANYNEMSAGDDRHTVVDAEDMESYLEYLRERHASV
jgi:hypothetical protein